MVAPERRRCWGQMPITPGTSRASDRATSVAPADVQFTHRHELDGKCQGRHVRFRERCLGERHRHWRRLVPNTLNYSAYRSSLPVTVNLTANTATGTGGISGIESVVGGQGSDTLVGPAAGSTWNLAGANAGTVAGVSLHELRELDRRHGGRHVHFRQRRHHQRHHRRRRWRWHEHAELLRRTPRR